MHELAERYEFDALPDREAYELGRSDGAADGTDHRAWEPHRARRVLDSLRDQLLYAWQHYGRPTRAYTVGYARGYREAAR